MFKKAERSKTKLRIGLSGISGSGKTWTSLLIATGIILRTATPQKIGKIALIDTESGRGNLYGSKIPEKDYWAMAQECDKTDINNFNFKANNFIYDILEINAPYSPEKYMQAIAEAENLGYEVLIIDSLSHAWAGDGGILSQVDKAGGNFSVWGKIGTPKQNKFVDSLVNSKLHLIFTMRSKSDYIIEMVTNKHGKEVAAPRKIGMAPIQRDGLEYECTIYMQMDASHVAHVSKDNTHLFDQEYLVPDPKMGMKIIDWLNTAKDIDPVDENDRIEKRYIESIDACLSLQELQYIFKESKTFFKGQKNESILAKIILAKDRKKNHLMSVQEKVAQEMANDRAE